MHDCQNTKEKLLDSLFGEANESAAARRLETEIRRCAVCESEYAAIRQTFAEYEKFSKLDVPKESYWQNYEAALSQKLMSVAMPERKKSFLADFLNRFPAWQIRVPAPVAAALAVLFAVAAFFAGSLLTNNVQRVENSVPPQIQIVPIEREKVVVQEKEIWRDRVAIQKVYVPRRENKVKNSAQSEFSARAKSEIETTEKSAPTLNLAEFQPPPKVEPKIVAEGKFDEK